MKRRKSTERCTGSTERLVARKRPLRGSFVPASGFLFFLRASIVLFLLCPSPSAQQSGSVRGTVLDADFGAPLPLAQVRLLAEDSDRKTATTDDGLYVFGEVPPGKYTLVFAKEGYVRKVVTDVVVVAGQLTDVDASLSGEFSEMEEFVVQDIQIGAGSEAALLELRFASPSVMDTISADLMSRAGASDAASALRLVAGTSIQEDKFAVVRGLPDRYVNSQMNGVRLPTAEEDKRAVELDQFPAAVIEGIEVTKTFTPDQQGDASGGAVNVRLRGVPNETSLNFKAEYSLNTNVAYRSSFLSYEGGGVSALGFEDGGRVIQPENQNWEGAVGVSETDAPLDYKLSVSGGHKVLLEDDVLVGGYLNLFYERDSSFYDDGINDSLWVREPGGPLEPETSQGTPEDGNFRTSLFDVTQGRESVQWGGLATLGLETENNTLGLTYLYTRTAEDVATLAEDTRSKEFYFPGYDRTDSMGPGNTPGTRLSAPYLRTETLEYTERTTQTAQLAGFHRLPYEGFVLDETFTFLEPEVDWRVAYSTAALDQPDKRQFGSLWVAPSYNPGFPPFIPPFTDPAEHRAFKPDANFNFGNLQRIFKKIDEESFQYAMNLKLPFEQWSGEEGYLKLGWFDDSVDREFEQETFSNFGEDPSFFGDWGDFWSDVFPDEDHPISGSLRDIDYEGDQQISAWYVMGNLPVTPTVNLVGGVRFESTRIGIVLDPEEEATWYPPGETSDVGLEPGDADASISEDDTLPAIGLVYTPAPPVTLRAFYSETIARPTFKELTPVLQQEFLGAPIFIGNPDLQLASVENYDLRLDYVPYEGGLVSVSWFEKDLTDPIENIQRIRPFTFTTPVNFPEGELQGWELELRQSLGRLTDVLEGFFVGANATFIDSEVTIPEALQELFEDEAILAPQSKRDATGAPEYLYNLFLAYDSVGTGTQAAIFYTVTGDTLFAGAGVADGNFVPDIYEKEYDTLNLSISKRLGRYFQLTFKAKNLTNPEIQTIYRSAYIPGDATRTSFTRGVEFSLAVGLNIAL